MPDTSSTPYRAINFTQVKFTTGFWEQRQRVNREVTLGIQYQQCKETGRLDAFKWSKGMPNEPHIFWDSDVAKWIEAASYSLSTHPDAKLEAQLDEVIATMAAAQQEDGYLNSHFQRVEPHKRWTNLRDWHELYCAGHLIEAAVAHFQATGKRSLLDVMCKYVDCIDATFGPEPGKKRGYCGHEEIELALVKLHGVTGEPKHLKLAQFFVDERGAQPHYYDIEAKARGDNPAHYWHVSYEYNQAHQPVREQSKIVGHAVRAMYLYCAMADLAAATGDHALLAACHRIWDDLIQTKTYLTGGIGSSRHNEGFTWDYHLPNDTAYCETCAAVGLVFWAHRLLQIDCDSRFADVMERALYNGVISGVSLDGSKFFYVNPLSSPGTHHRQAWFGCACCPPNLARMLSSLGQYVYSVRGANELAVHLYGQSTLQTTLSSGVNLSLDQTTQYPWDGRVTMTLKLSKPAPLTLRLRIPDWCRSHEIHVNGQKVTAPIERGYALVQREWRSGDQITLELAMEVERIAAHPRVDANVGRVALQRGPVVYCIEQADHTAPVPQIVLPMQAKITTKHEADLFDGVTTLHATAAKHVSDAWQGKLYRRVDPAAGGELIRAAECQPAPLRAIPYFAWDNRTEGPMAVWLPSMR